MSLYERTEKEMADNAELFLFATRDGKKWSCRIRSIATVDAWLEQSDAILLKGDENDALAKRVNELQGKYLQLNARFEQQGDAPEPSPMPDVPEVSTNGMTLGPARKDPSPLPDSQSTEEKRVTLGEIEDAKKRFDSVMSIWRQRLREYLTEMFDAVCEYDEKLNRDLILRGEVTDAQVIGAFMKLRYHSDPLAQAQSVSAQMAKARLEAIRP
ncbi:MAG: hypothetical protein WC655_24410 [Candidatus Hydrogenedentales bacterium]|jgi:hypothetical protein